MGAEPLGLTGAGFEHLGAEFGGGWAGGHLGELGERDGGDLDVQVDAVEQGAGDATEVLLDLGRRAGAGAAGIRPVSAGTGIHGGDEDEVGGESRAAEGPADGHLAFLERLAQDLERLAIELGHLVEEEDALVGQADLARLGRAAAADQAGVADGVVRGAERPHGHQRLAGLQEAHHAVDARGLQALGGGQWGQDRRQALGQQGLAGSGRTDHQEVMVNFTHSCYAGFPGTWFHRTFPGSLPMARAYSYTRFSTLIQESGDSLRRQTERSLAWCKSHGHILDDSLRLHDKGVSAWTGDNRTSGKLGAFLAECKAGRVPKGSILIVESLDRLSRQGVRIALKLFLDILDYGVSIVTLQPEYTFDADNVDEMSLIIAIVVMGRSHEESDMKSYRGREAWEHKRSQARWSNLLASVRCG